MVLNLQPNDKKTFVVVQLLSLREKATLLGAILCGTLASLPANAEPATQCSRNADDIKSAMVIQNDNGEFCAVDEVERKKQQDALAASLAPSPPSVVKVPKAAAGSKTAKSELVWQSAPRELGLQQLVNAGAIRPSTQRDVLAWFAAASAAGTDVSNGGFFGYDTYVVLKPIAAPADMYGAHSREFIVPNGVPLPIDDGSHNTYYLMASGTCMGVATGCTR